MNLPLEGEVIQGSNLLNRALLVKPIGEMSVYVGVQPYATVLDLRNGEYKPIDVTDIGPGDEVKCFGVHECPHALSPKDFYAFVVLVIK